METCGAIAHLRVLLDGEDTGLRGAAEQALSIIADIQQHGMTPLSLECLQHLLDPIFEDTSAPLRDYLMRSDDLCPICEALKRRFVAHPH